ncbi:hypothetical protein [Rhodococcus opacus]|uniref:Uncharacterized protein n=2 Tax=Rhodococcus opacus TaxID=37919 RepID=A0AAX3YTS3_RHOOP|nr:hypothetical protein [Rhodococcus opacus]WLF51518.1 hypothetical protein Q5707_39225 [Rhodococcus opacus]BAH56109.1 hypothetical membrane protein [Rhodococcus opacus B4]
MTVVAMWIPSEAVTEPLLQLGRYVMWIIFAILTIRLVWYGGLFAWNKQQNPYESEPAARIGMTLGAAVLCSAGSGIAAALLTF